MSDAEIIRIFFQASIPDDHPAVYQYIMGKERSKVTAVNNILKTADGILTPPYTIGFIKDVVKSFLTEKELEYREGLIEIKPIY